MWRLWNFLFGIDYVLYRDAFHREIYRVIKLKNGHFLMKCKYDIYTYILLPNGELKDSPRGVSYWTPLTWDGSLPNYGKVPIDTPYEYIE